MSLNGKNNEEKIWNYLRGKGLSDFGVAGLMGNLYAESALQPNNLQNTYEKKLGYTDDEYVKAVDSGAYSNFVHDSAGFGLAQWTFWSRKQGLYDFAKSNSKSIGDLEMQLDYLYKELSENFKSVLSTLKTAKTILEASNSVLLNFERPANQDTTVQEKRASYGKVYLDKYSNAKEDNAPKFKMRTTKPEAGNKYYITKANGGYSNAIQGSPKDKDCDVLSNCVGYAYGRFNEIGGYGSCKYLSPVNAENFIQYKGNCTVGQTPKLGACMVWQKGASLSGSDGAGHVAIVENVISDTEIVTSESGWGSSTPFWTQTRKKGDGNWGQSSSYKFLGFIYNPAVKDGTTVENGSVKKETTTTVTTSLKYKNGDIVDFQGNTHYSSSNATSGSSCKAGVAKVTSTAKGAKHPYHLIRESNGGSTVYGWVDENTIAGLHINTTVNETKKEEKTMSNSSLVSYTKISPNKNSPRNHAIDTITIHCVVGQVTVERLGEIFAPASREASSNYGVGCDGKIGMYVEEKDRSWCSSNAANDHRAITIEVASDTEEPYAVNDKAYNALIELVADICKRNGIKKLVWSTNKNDRVNHLNGCNMTVHRDYANKSCPGKYLYDRHGDIAAKVNAKLGATTTTPTTSTQTTSVTDDVYVVKYGDTLSGIAAKYNTTYQKLAEYNGIPNPNKISVGQKIKIPVTKVVSAPATPTPAPAQPATATSVTLKAGTKLALNGVALYGSSSATVKANTKTGTFYLWDAAVTVNGKVRITNSTGNVGKAGQVTGWITLDDAKKAAGATASTTSTTANASAFTQYLVKVTASELNIRKGAGTNYAVTGCIRDKGVYTIVAESAGAGASKGWGKLKSGAGWISLDYCTKC